MELNQLIDALNWRYATKTFDSSRKVPSNIVNSLLEATRLSASSFGLQPWKFYVIEDMAIRQKLKPVSWNQSQITDCSHLIVITHKTSIDEKYINTYIEDIAITRGVSAESLNSYRELILGSISSMQGDKGREWMARQAYIALGTLLAACAVAKVDACPMEGFERSAYDEILDLSKEGFTAIALCPIGYRSSQDKYANAKKVRFSNEIIIGSK